MYDVYNSYYYHFGTFKCVNSTFADLTIFMLEKLLKMYGTWVNNIIALFYKTVK